MQEWTVGPIPTADNVGKEVIIRSITELQTGEGSMTPVACPTGIHQRDCMCKVPSRWEA